MLLVGLEFEDDVLVFGQVDIKVVESVHPINQTGQLNGPGRNCEVTHNFDISVIIRQLGLRHVKKSLAELKWCRLIGWLNRGSHNNKYRFIK